jgi:hypothetical protein
LLGRSGRRQSNLADGLDSVPGHSIINVFGVVLESYQVSGLVWETDKKEADDELPQDRLVVVIVRDSEQELHLHRLDCCSVISVDHKPSVVRCK